MIVYRVLIICGPTATGKTALALKLAKQFNGELVSADSRQVYRGMDIGTGKDLPRATSYKLFAISVKFRNKKYNLGYYKISDIPLWMYDVINPDEEFSVAHYQTLASEIIADIWQRNKLPIVIGGTGLYIKSLISPLETAVIPRNFELRKRLANATVVELQNELKNLTPEIFTKLNNSDRQNPRRLIRKIEIVSQKLSLAKKQSPVSQQDIVQIGLMASLKDLYQRIDQRVEERVKQGIVAEIKDLLAQGYSWDLPAMSGLGYQEWQKLSAVTFRLSAQEKRKIIERWKRDEHDYARRQLTWFKKQIGIHWFDVAQKDYQAQLTELVATWYTKFK